MKGLLLKDWYLAKKYLKRNILVIALFLILNIFTLGESFSFLVVYPCMFCSIFPTALLSLDERSGWDRYCCTLPVTRTQFVTAKYLTGLLPSFVVMLLTLLAVAIGHLIRGSLDLAVFPPLAVMLVVAATVLPGINYMVMFKDGTEQSRFAYYLVIIGSIVLSALLTPVLEVWKPGLSASMIMVLMIAASIGFYVFSWWTSLRLYEKRELG